MNPKIATAGADLLSVNPRERAIRAPLVTLSLMRMLGLTTALASVVIVPVKAASADTPASTTAVERKFTLNIPAQKLSSALVALSNATGTQLAYTTQLSDGLRSSAISGTMSVNAALAQILSGTGLTYRFNGNTVVLTKASANITLGPVRVGGTVTHQDPTGPGIGYVATTTTAGTKTDTPIMEIPNSIYVITKQLMVDQQPQNVMEALRYTPGVYAESLGTANTGAPDSQNNAGGGFLQRGFSSMQFVDGLQTNSESAAETSFLERVEVVNGPASVMYGQTSPGGLIGMSLKKPTDVPLHQVSLGFGNWGRYEATLDMSDKITKSGNLRYRIATIGDTQGNQTDYTKYHRVGMLPSLTWDIDNKTSLTLIGSYVYTPGAGTYTAGYPAHGTLLPGEYGRIARSTFLGEPNWNESSSKSAMFEYLFKHDFNKYLRFEQTFRWEKSEEESKLLSLSGGYDATHVERTPMMTDIGNTTIGMDARFTGKIKTGPLSHTWVVGMDFRKYDVSFGYQYDYTQGDNLINIYNPTYGSYSPCYGYGASCQDFGGKSSFTIFQKGVYFQDQIKYNGISIILGGRNDWVNNTNTISTKNNLADQNYTTTYNSVSKYTPQSAFTWRAGIVYNFNFGLAPYFSYSTSFLPQTGFGARGQTFSPLTGKQIEAGLKYKIPKTDVLLTASAFHIDENHYLITDPNNTQFSADAGRVTSKGFEVSANANITKNLHLVASYSYTNAQYTKTNLTTTQIYTNEYTISRGNDVSQKGKYIQTVPRNMTSIFLDYSIPGAALRGLGVNGGVRYVGFTYNDAANSFKIPAYVLFDIGAHYDFGKNFPALKGLRAQLSMSNLTNKYYVTSCSTNACYLGQGRRVYGNISYSW